MAENQRSGAQSVYRALSVLEVFDESRVALSAAEMAALSGLTVPTAHRIANALVDRGFLIRDDVSRCYGIGPAIVRLSQIATSGESSFAFLDPLIDYMRDTWEETVGLHVRVGHARVCVRELESPHRVRVVSGVGQTYALTAAAASKAILAYTADAQFEQLSRLDPQIGDPDFLAVLDQIRSAGFATSAGETIPGAHAVAAPILDADGHAAAAINVTGPASRLPADRLNEIGNDLVARLRSIHDARYAGLMGSGR